MPTRHLPAPAWTAMLAAARRRAGALRTAWQRLRERRARASALRRAERELAEMSLRGLHDIGAPGPLLERRHRDDDALRRQAWTHLRG